MAQHSIVKLAEQGEPRAIAFLLTRTLQKYGISARANLKGSCLKLLLEGQQIPHQTTMVKLVSQGMQKLNISAIQTVKLYGKKLDSPVPAWRQLIELTPPSATLNPETELFNAEPAAGAASSSLDVAAAEPELGTLQGKYSDADTPIFQLDDLDPDTMILLPVERPLQFEDLDPDALILYPLEPESSEEVSEEVIDISALDTSAPDDSTLVTSAPVTSAPLIATAEPDLLEGFEDNMTHTEGTPIEPLAARMAKVPKLPKRLTFFLLIWLGLQIAMNTLILAYALLGAGSFALYTGLDLSNTNQPFASLLSVVVSIADFIVTPIDRFGIWAALIAILLTLFWVHRLHLTLKAMFERYPISPMGAIWRLVIPIVHLWGIWTTFFTLAAHLATRDSLKRISLNIRRLTGWFCLLLLALMGWYAYRIWGFETATTTAAADPTPEAVRSLWVYVIKDALLWLLAVTWFRLAYAAWRGTRIAYREIMAPFLPPRPDAKPPRRKAGAVDISAILLGAGVSLLSLAAFNCLLGLIATLVFVNTGLPPESIVPTFYDSESLLTMALLGSFLCIGLGGFLTAHLAEKGLLHALGLGILLTLIGVALQQSRLFPALAELPFWFQTVSTALIIPAALVGGGLRQWLRSL